MRINEIYIGKPKYEGSRSKPITEEEFLAHRPDFSEILNKTPIFRGIKDQHSPFLYVDPSTSAPRKSANIDNYYTLLIDNLPSWAAYPKRSRSLICTTVTHSAGNYGRTYRVFPVNGSKIGLCRNGDMWHSMGKLRQYEMFVNNFAEQLEMLYRRVMGNGELTHTLDDTNYHTFVSQINELSKKLHSDPAELVDAQRWVRELGAMLADHPQKDLMTLFAEFFDPHANGFALQTTANFDPSVVKREFSSNNEVWTEGPAYLIELKTARRLGLRDPYEAE